MKRIFWAVLVVCGLAAGSARADLVFSTSATDANAGTTVNMFEGDTASLYIWVSSLNGQTINGMGLDILSNDAAILQAISHTIENPIVFGSTRRWNGTPNGGTLGDLAIRSRAAAVTTPGVSTSGASDFVLHSTLQFTATALGSTEITFREGQDRMTAVGQGSIFSSISRGTANVNVLTAVPEPGSFAVLGLAGLACAGVRRFRKGNKLEENTEV